MQPDQLLELWTIAMKLPNGKLAALSAALNLLAASTSPIPLPPKGCKATPLEPLWLLLPKRLNFSCCKDGTILAQDFEGLDHPGLDGCVCGSCASSVATPLWGLIKLDCFERAQGCRW